MLPPFVGLALHQITVLRSPAQCDAAYRAIKAEMVVGFDTESKPTFTRGADSNGPHIIQFALRERAFLVQIGDTPPLAFLRDVMGAADIVKVGFGLDSDRGPILTKLGIELRGVVELTSRLRVLGYKEDLGAKAAVAIVLGQRLQKSRSATTSNWAAAHLKPNQILYAANDAYAALCVYRALGPAV